VHGMGVDGKTNWYKQISYLSKHFNLLVPDLIYFGQSTAKENNYSVEFQVEQIHELLEKLKINSKINVMGFSYGGLIASVYNQFYHSETNKLIIIDGPVKFFSGRMADSLAKIAGVPTIYNILIPQTIADYKGMEKAVMSKRFFTTKRFKLKLIRYYFTPTLESRRLQINYLLTHQNIYQDYNYNINTTPTLLIWGGYLLEKNYTNIFQKQLNLLSIKKGSMTVISGFQKN
jgi:pimeloyl-ACP methyl ester carboxylesterase